MSRNPAEQPKERLAHVVLYNHTQETRLVQKTVATADQNAGTSTHAGNTIVLFAGHRPMKRSAPMT
jgi:hypothetical protein